MRHSDKLKAKESTGCCWVPEGSHQTLWWPGKAIRERNALANFAKYEKKGTTWSWRKNVRQRGEHGPKGEAQRSHDLWGELLSFQSCGWMTWKDGVRIRCC